MAKKIFQNYTFNFDSNETKLLTTFCKQVIGQMQNNGNFSKEVSIFNSIIDKLHSGKEEIKLTKLEKTRLALQLKENRKYLDEQIRKSWIFKRWLLKTMYKQYDSIITNHFEN